MKLVHPAIAAALGLAFCGAAFAQAGTVQRDVNQQQRIEQGLQSGQLTTREASKLEREESRVERDQSRAMQDGKLSPAEKARLERGEARIDRKEARAGANGKVNAAEQRRIQRAENRESRRIYKEKHDAQTK